MRYNSISEISLSGEWGGCLPYGPWINGLTRVRRDYGCLFLSPAEMKAKSEDHTVQSTINFPVSQGIEMLWSAVPIYH